MDYSKFRPSQNVENNQNDPWSPLYQAYAAIGLQGSPWNTLKRMGDDLWNRPFEPAIPTYAQQLQKYGPLPSAPPAGDLSVQAGYNSPYWGQFGPLANLPADQQARLNQPQEPTDYKSTIARLLMQKPIVGFSP